MSSGSFFAGDKEGKRKENIWVEEDVSPLYICRRKEVEGCLAAHAEPRVRVLAGGAGLEMLPYGCGAGCGPATMVFGPSLY